MISKQKLKVSPMQKKKIQFPKKSGNWAFNIARELLRIENY